MSSESDGNSEMEITETDENWREARKKRPSKRKRTKEINQEEINNIILGPSSSQTTKNTEINIPQKTLHNKNTNINRNSNIHYAPIMRDIQFRKYQHIFHITTDKNYTRINFTDLWAKIYPNAKDTIISTKNGLLLKTDSDKNSIRTTLEKMIERGNILQFKESAPNTTQPSSFNNLTSYSVVIASVEQEIEDKTISDFLNKSNLEHRFCKRITSKATNRPTSLIRIITGSQKTSEKLLSNGLFFKYRHYPVYPSKPPDPAPKPCGKCHSFEHPSEACQEPIKCLKCKGNHPTIKCSSPLTPKCHSCNAEDHQAWSYKCPNRPRNPIQGIPNIPIKTLNKKSHEVSKENKKSRIHQPLTIHDTIINSYVNELNDPKVTNREELLVQLRKRFVNNFRVDSVAVFSGNRIYILMFDLEQADSHRSPTEPLNNENNEQYEHVDA